MLLDNKPNDPPISRISLGGPPNWAIWSILEKENEGRLLTSIIDESEERREVFNTFYEIIPTIDSWRDIRTQEFEGRWERRWENGVNESSM